MELASLLERAVAADVTGMDRAGVCALLGDLGRLKCWIAARELAAVRRLAELPEVTFPEATVAESTREPLRDAQRVSRRVATVGLFARFEKALQVGEINTAHVDALTGGLADVPETRRDALIAHQDRLLDAARCQTPEKFARTMRDTVRQVLSEEDAKAKLGRQQRATSLSMWTNRATGMIHLRGQFDPETGAELAARIDAARQQLFPDRNTLPETCPADPGERDDHLRALTLTRLLLDPEHAPGWRPETLVVVDEQTRDHGYHSRSIVDIGADVDLAHDALQLLAARGRAVPVTTHDGVVTSVGGRTNLDRGRTTRLADIDQRRALRAMYPCCAIPDCPVRFRHCDIHHAHWWEHGGRTDLSNLLPLCSRHHHAIHDRGWTVHLDPITRDLTVTRPGGIVTTTHPPYAFAA